MVVEVEAGREGGREGGREAGCVVVQWREGGRVVVEVEAGSVVVQWREGGSVVVEVEAGRECGGAGGGREEVW